MAASDSEQISAKSDEGARDENDVNEAEQSRSKDSPDFPDGGARAWSIALGSSAVLFCTLGSVSSFGYDLSWLHHPGAA
jgi:hypothetical protein